MGGGQVSSTQLRVGTSGGESTNAGGGHAESRGAAAETGVGEGGGGARPVNRPGILVVTSGRWLTAAASQGRLAALAPDSDRLAVCAVNPRPLAV